MDLKELKKLVKKYGIKDWIEAGIDVIKIGDKLVEKSETFSRLDYYNKNFGIEFVKFDQCKMAQSGRIILNNNLVVHYNINMPPKE